MALAFVPRFFLPVAQRSFNTFIRCCCIIVNHLHVHQNHGRSLGRAEVDPFKDGSSTNESPPANADVFENPLFVSTDYKDDRAAAKLANIASHANTRAHAKNCDCKTCRDRIRAFSKSGSGRHHGYRGRSSQRRGAADDSESFLRSLCGPDTPSQESVANPLAGHSFLGAPQHVSRLHGGHLKILKAGSNHFAALDVEKTRDDDENHPNAEECQDRGSEEISSNVAAQLVTEDASGYTEESSTLHPLAQRVAPLDPDDTDLEDNDHIDKSATALIPTPACSKSIKPHTSSPPKLVHPAAFHSHQNKPALSEIAIHGGSETSADFSRQMPWEEDNWAERKVWGVRCLSWTRTRLALRYTQGDGEVEYLVESQML